MNGCCADILSVHGYRYGRGVRYGCLTEAAVPFSVEMTAPGTRSRPVGALDTLGGAHPSSRASLRFLMFMEGL